MTHARTALACCGIFLAAAALLLLIYTSEPRAERSGAVRETAVPVRLAVAERGDWRPRLAASGQVEPAREIELAARVGGQVLEVNPVFAPGALLKKGDWVLSIDPADYRNRLAERRGALAEAEAQLALEEGRSEVARRDYELLGEDLPPARRALVLREPQLEAARAAVEAARGALRQAGLDLERCRVTAPFDALVLEQAAFEGTQVSAGSPLGRLAGTREYRVSLSLPLARLPWIELPADDEAGAAVRLRQRSAWAEGESRRGEVFRLLGELGGETRMARLLVSVADPLSSAEGPPLLLGSYVEAEVEGRLLQDCVRLRREHLRAGDRVWLYTEGVLEFRRVRVLLRDASFVYLSEGLEGGEQVVVTNLARVREGAALRPL